MSSKEIHQRKLFIKVDIKMILLSIFEAEITVKKISNPNSFSKFDFISFQFI